MLPLRQPCVYVGHTGEQCKNGWTDRDAVSGVDSRRPTTTSRPLTGKGTVEGSEMSLHAVQRRSDWLAVNAGANYIQGGDADVSCTAWLCTTLLTWRRHSRVSPTCHTDARSVPPPVNSSTLRPVVSQRSGVVPFLLLEQMCAIAVTLASSLSVFKNWLKTYLFHRCYETVWLWMSFPILSHYLSPEHWSLQ